MRPQFDERDAEILNERIAAWQQRSGPRVGDFVQMPDNTMRRFTHDWGDDIQTTVGAQHPCNGDASFYFGAGFMSFSGSLDRAINKVALREIGHDRLGRCWFFHHDFPQAHSGVDVQVPCRVYEYRESA